MEGYRGRVGVVEGRGVVGVGGGGVGVEGGMESKEGGMEGEGVRVEVKAEEREKVLNEIRGRLKKYQ